MSTIILYSTRHGAAKKCAELLKFKLFGAELVDIKEKPGFDVTPYDTVVIGGSVQAGRVKGELKKFCKKNMAVLLTKKLGLFICCMAEGKEAEDEIKNNFPPELYEKAVVKDYFGGIFDFTKMNFIEKFIIGKVAKVKESVFKIKEDRIAKFAEEIKK